MYTGKRILIIGGTGTIGQQMVKELLAYNPKVIRVFSRDEYKQYEMENEYREYHKQLRFLIGDVRDYTRVQRAMENIDYVFHLAAMKHVPACEYNPFEAVQTNVIGTQNVIQSAMQAGVKKVLFTSTDKAISPTNTYGATKLTAERLISAAEYMKGPKSTVFSSVRFGNVMGSRGSVIPLFKKQILEKGYITVTDPNMLRYMMTPSQAISLMLKANELAQGGEVFVLKMPIVKLGDLAQIMIEEVTKKYGIASSSVDVRKIGLRPGEKLYEELMTNDEAVKALETEEMYILQSIFTGRRKYLGIIKSGVENMLPKKEMAIRKEMLRDWILSERLI
ncbi:UDP-N-acetylglucosamine 4,6-dehydratase family protein [Aneurinibacillus migulanus]|uniref:Membrane protein n=1 Tax=Aneurinibacillus migulanus TaxID=47500 RepID=A0A0D1XZF6_ANEMI|nr:UDP-N-acetylglucosamine 4,6-dehydratase family protein [Aneurinibacillus migulanus]KIV52432.1 membrane protein [Aneurinibacillus migulanus]KON94608.1 membrane protein [Aneurinibacillus migulanus]MED0892656.1 polysaccharide biosynthesis protein [Aneurinibacillus migulanus]MED1614297.1 polysaccharide biosynthesis protein [Aneurinibacillus migulanus]SDI47850.1 Polysaccharide biosynthesis protein [Aneurinibacillus migulanus]